MQLQQKKVTAILPKRKVINKNNLSSKDIETINALNVTLCILNEQLENILSMGIKFPRLNNKAKNMLVETEPFVADFLSDVVYKQAPTEMELYTKMRIDLCNNIARTTTQDNFPFIKYMNNYKPQQDKYVDRVREEISDKKIIKELQDKIYELKNNCI